MAGRVAFVPPRYGAQIVGGAEALTREIAMGLAERSWDVEVLTTRVVDHFTWANDLPEGSTREDGLTVRRFSTVAEPSTVGLRAQKLIEAGTMPARDDQWTWVSWRFRVPDLYSWLLRHGDTYDAVVFAPYMFWNSTACLAPVAERAVAMPCLHDEFYARLEVMRPVLALPRSVWFLAEPEHELAHRLGPVAEHHTVTGAGVHVPGGYDPQGFRRRYGLERPFLLYAGRREKDKGWGWLVDTFEDAVRRGLDGVDLVSLGAGEVDVPASLAGRLHDLGFVSEADRNDAFAAALAYVQPSRMESFSRTVMESWLAGTPVLAIEGSEVVDWHCRRSGGGALFASPTDLTETVRAWLRDPAGCERMASAGRDYVLREYSWPVVLDRMEADLMEVSRLAGGASTRERAAPATTRRRLVIGSFPPVPGPAARVSVEEVRRAWAEGEDAVTVSPRPSAAQLSVPLTGLLAGRRLRNVRRFTGCDRAVLVVERGFPLPAGPLQFPTAVVLWAVLRRFSWVRVVRCGEPGSHPLTWRLLRLAATETDDAAAGSQVTGVTPLGPPERHWRARLRRRARASVGAAARRVLGDRAPAARAVIKRLLGRR